jgi:hypothetical protein
MSVGYVKILDLKNGIEADLLDAALTERKIPHVIRTMHDTAYDGLYQAIIGWGWVEAPDSARADILEIYDDIIANRDASELVDDAPERPEEENPAAPPVKSSDGRLGLLLLGLFIVLLALALLLGAVVGRFPGKPGRRHGLAEPAGRDAVVAGAAATEPAVA